MYRLSDPKEATPSWKAISIPLIAVDIKTTEVTPITIPSVVELHAPYLHELQVRNNQSLFKLQ
jgi:hypothetical protein